MLCMLLRGASCLGTMPADHALRFRQNNTFKVVQFTDLHLGGNEEEDQITMNVSISRTLV